MMPPPETQQNAPARDLQTIASRDACPSCGSPFAAGQRYCIECGERVGDPRLPVMDGRTQVLPPQGPPPPPSAYPATTYPPPPSAPAGMWSSGMALLSTIAVLLLAMGVGVLIGDRGGSEAASTQPVILGGVGATAATGATTDTGAASTDEKASASADSDTKSGVDADAIAKKNGVKLAPKDVDLGQECEKGSVGCSDSGEFDGNYFE